MVGWQPTEHNFTNNIINRISVHEMGHAIVGMLSPNHAKVSKVVVDEENNLIEVVVAEDQLSLAIGRGGQNVKLASKLVGYKIDVMTDDQESARRTAEFNQASKL